MGTGGLGPLLTHVSVKSELILSSKLCPNFRGGHVYNRGHSSKFGAAVKAKRTGSGEVLIPVSL
jgi:hypothetical protein